MTASAYTNNNNAGSHNNSSGRASEPSTNGYAPHQSNGYSNGHGQPMDGRQGEYSQSGLSSPHPQSSAQQHHPESIPADQGSGAQYPQGQDVKYNPSATPTSDYGLSTPSSRSSQFPQYQDQRYQPNGAQQPNHMAQPSNPPMSASSPTYPQHHYAPYGGHPDMPPYQHPPGLYPRPGDYAPPGYAHPHAMPGHYGHVAGPPMMGRPGPPGGGHPLSTVYSFVPIPGTHQQKRPRRRYEEIERIYKCGWNGCEKAYGTLNHLNAHVTMQAHGVKRTPEEFKEIRKEWKQRKKDEDSVRKADEERHRQQGGHPPPGQVDGHNGGEQGAGGYPQGVQRQLPPLGYAPAGGHVPAQYGQPPQAVDGMPHQYSGPPVQSYYPPQSPYGPQNPQM